MELQPTWSASAPCKLGFQGTEQGGSGGSNGKYPGLQIIFINSTIKQKQTLNKQIDVPELQNKGKKEHKFLVVKSYKNSVGWVLMTLNRSIMPNINHKSFYIMLSVLLWTHKFIKMPLCFYLKLIESNF